MANGPSSTPAAPAPIGKAPEGEPTEERDKDAVLQDALERFVSNEGNAAVLAELAER